MRSTRIAALTAALALLLCACRTRTTLTVPEPLPEADSKVETLAPDAPAPVRLDAAAEEPREPEPGEDASSEPDASAEPDEASGRREYAPDASGELTDGAEDALYAVAEELAPTLAPKGGDGGEPVRVEADAAERSATETAPAEEAEQLGVDEDGAVADSAQTYYLTLLSDRLGSLFECKRLYVYWETAADHTTVYKTSREHKLILGAGAYDVSAKLLEENLTVDDGWIGRKNPDAVVKIVDGGVLGSGVQSAAAARSACDALAARDGWGGMEAVANGRVLLLSGELLNTQAGRTAAMVYLAKLLYPEQLSDVDADEALRALSEEVGRAASGLFAYAM